MIDVKALERRHSGRLGPAPMPDLIRARDELLGELTKDLLPTGAAPELETEVSDDRFFSYQIGSDDGEVEGRIHFYVWHDGEMTSCLIFYKPEREETNAYT